MKRRMKFVAITVVVVAVAAAIGYEVWTSSPGSACASTYGTPAALSGRATSVPHAGAPVGTAVPGSPKSPAPVRSAISAASGNVIPVVAAENFWGSLVSQLGGNDTSVLGIVTDPNADPHEYEANSSDAIAISNAKLLIVNGVGYDDWALQLIAADGSSNQVVLNVGDLNGVSVTGGIVTGNPHMWYNPVYVNRTVAAMYSDLVSIQPASTSTFQANYAALNVSLGQLYSRADQIRAQFAGTEVAATESIFVYLANYTGLDLVSPPTFMEAIAEGNDPPAQSVVEFQCQLESGHIAVLIYNQQTVTPITNDMKAIAAENNVTTVGITETIQPPGVSFQVWMNAEYLELENALNSKALGQ